ncbi:NAD-dependent epimerase/dehydratase family protein [Catenisphaera adipataccumulans]|uniref:UDP-glucose 4-epimerase n=1 Tax=Catenisphaera adipataccumulans TaxID=700500 RepID=A0A7W8FV93_9FIRM|nr:NAD-dependent epimerase/dehydratase family protein [Catenisphaera adipataccumulans]MBB5182903.1 UDP-glucose 4-epimerase [Catenisphaera adipataccumulans]
MKRVLVTGINSYVGNAFIQANQDTFQIDKISLRNVQWDRMDFSGYDVIFHVAGLAHSTPDESQRDLYYRVNTDLAAETAIHAKKQGVKQFIFMSSVIVYGSQHETIDRKTPLQPDNFYGDSKKRAEEMLLPLADEHFKVVIIRAPMIYGKGSKGNYPRLAKLARRTPVFPNYPNQRSMLYIENLSEFVKQCILNNVSGIVFPQNAEFAGSKDIVAEIAALHHHTVWFPTCFNAWIRKMKGTTVRKVFGNLTIDPALSKMDFTYQLYDFKESIRRTEQ